METANPDPSGRTVETDTQEPRDQPRVDAHTLQQADPETEQLEILDPEDDGPPEIAPDRQTFWDKYGTAIKRWGGLIGSIVAIATFTFLLANGYNGIRDVYDDRIATESEARRIEIDKLRNQLSTEDTALETRLREVEQELIRIQATLKSE